MLKLIIAIAYIIGSIAFGGYVIHLLRTDEDGIEVYGALRDAAENIFDGNRNSVTFYFCVVIAIYGLAWPLVALFCAYNYIVS